MENSEQGTDAPSKEEIIEIISKFKNNRNPGISDIT